MKNKATADRPDGIYSRPRVRVLLKQAVSRPLTVVAAPAAYGKTTAVADFLVDLAPTWFTGWLTLTGVHNHPGRFWRSMERVLHAAGLDTSEFTDVDNPDPSDMQYAFAQALSSLGSRDRLALVLDDFHLLTSPALVKSVENLVLQELSGLRLIVVTRTLPDFSVSNLALKQMLSVLGQDELRFSAHETKGWLKMRGTALSGEQVNRLMESTDGWIGGLYLQTAVPEKAENALSALADVGELMETEIFSLHDEEVREFLLSVCCLNEYPEALCTAVSGYAGIGEFFRRAARQNLFIRPPARGRENASYSVHQLFQEFLRRRQRLRDPEKYAAALVRAGDWYVANGDPYAGADCYRLGEDREKLLSVLMGFGSDADDFGINFNAYRRDEYLLRARLFEAVPASMLRERAPMLELFYIVWLLLLREHEVLAARVADMRAYYLPCPPSEIRNRILGELEVVMITTMFNDLEAKDRAATRAYGYLGCPSLLSRAPTPVLLGSCSALFVFGLGFSSLSEAATSYGAYWEKHKPLFGGLQAGLRELMTAELHYERGELNLALREADAFSPSSLQSSVGMGAHFLRLRLAAARGDLDCMLTELHSTECMAEEIGKKLLLNSVDFCWTFAGSLLNEPRVVPDWLDRGRLEESSALGSSVGLRVEAEPFARWLDASGRTDELAELLPGLQAEYEKVRSPLGLLCVALYRAHILHVRGDRNGAAACLREAWQRAEPDGLVMPFIERMPALYPLVQELRRDGGKKDPAFSAWLQQMDELMRKHSRVLLKLCRKWATVADPAALPALTRRETEVQALLDAGLPRSAIRERLGITGNNLNVIVSRIRNSSGKARLFPPGTAKSIPK